MTPEGPAGENDGSKVPPGTDESPPQRSRDMPPPTGRPVGDLPIPESPPVQKPPPKGRRLDSPSFGNSVARPGHEGQDPVENPNSTSSKSGVPERKSVPTPPRTGKGSRNAKPNASRRSDSFAPDTIVDLPRGAYTKGTLWKWGARAAGGGVVLVLLSLLVGAPASAFTFLLLTVVLVASLTFRVGLKTDPTLEMPANLPMVNIFGVALRLQDKFGDIMLTPAWNAIRRSTGTKWD